MTEQIPGVPSKWVAHTGLDYTVVMRADENTETAPINVSGAEAPQLAETIAKLLTAAGIA